MRWIKKYTEIQYLDEILRSKTLHMGGVGKWSDKNDRFVLKQYAKKIEKAEIYATCLTKAKDRFHFWYIFGKREKGVCLWFDSSCLYKDLERDETLIYGDIDYELPEKKKSISVEKLPFIKRPQYRDEREFRVLRYEKPCNGSIDKLAFSPSSLKKIYFNPWLNELEYNEKKNEIEEILEAESYKIKCKQNRCIDYKKWQDNVLELLPGHPQKSIAGG